MYQCIVFPSDYTPFKQELILTGCVVAYELLTYPIDFIGNRSIQRETYLSKSLIQESSLIYSEVNHFLIFYDCWFKVQIDLSLSKIVLRYYIFNYLYFKYAFKNYISPRFKDEDENKGFDITPENSTVYPLLRYAKMTDPLVLLIAATSNLIGMIASHPISILKVRLQNEILKQHETKNYSQKMTEMSRSCGNQMWIKTTFGSRFLYTYLQFIAEMGLFQFCLNKLGYEFLNVFRPNQYFNGNIITVGFSVIGSSLISTLLLQPIYIYQQRSAYQVITKQPKKSIKSFYVQLYQKEKAQGFLKGYIHNALRSISRNGIAVGTLWGLATKANKERFRPSED
ncbi:unnamed protein product (macronuclear) [Paramecium tetraurelia]|uniref:Mitochondrial carrier protein n=1 Tax=Paramecium tetraurelia TaxID=5888 RepID=A0CJI1_PARTE|nr:uncharacterized protein GSPATT00000659001 [Paramecium tetraurelia]CAK70948.1 unnamed protein product [Paramecium tetraurelia]|eukprot:XP_001438345.1 hypothetical protein (macronuclear) [Paramecium tetraurelia strain d4-2]